MIKKKIKKIFFIFGGGDNTGASTILEVEVGAGEEEPWPSQFYCVIRTTAVLRTPYK